MNELYAEVNHFQKLENINAGCQNLADLMADQDSQIESWRNAVDNGGLGCEFVPQGICSFIASCSFLDARCVSL